jgi:hypothetical protein
MPRRRTTAALAAAALLAAAGVVVVRRLRSAPSAVAIGTYAVVADMGRVGFRSVVWTAGTAAEALEIARRIPAAFGRAWAEDPDGRPLNER